ncbi:MAG: hypothetical protein IPM63_08390 [Acidobacteriota bacterium]|nr:MAG: hypothetical protein IPM63_08390 [Acidobacteriota bacterium]
MRTTAVISAVLLLSVLAAAQDYSRLERSADRVKDAAEVVSKATGDAFQRGRQNSSDAIEQAFLAEQVLAAAKLMEKLVSDKYEIGDLRLAANVLKELSENFPASGGSWGALKNSIDSLVFDLAAGASGPPTPPPATDDGREVDESRILGRFFWNGEIDDEVQLTVSGTRITSKAISGRTLEDGTYSFTSALPREDGLIVRAVKTDGRGIVSVIQQPSAENDYSAVIRIVDEGSGARPYSLEIYWYKGN